MRLEVPEARIDGSGWRGPLRFMALWRSGFALSL